MKGSIYTYFPCIYAYMAIHTLAHQLSCIYVYIYAAQDAKHHAQAAGAAGSCSKHSITIQWSPLEATVGFY